MSVRGLNRRLDRTVQSVPLMDAPELRAYITFVAETHDLPVDELLAETEATLARARKAARRQATPDLLGWLAAESGQSAEEIRAEADALLRAWREQGR